MGGQPIIITFQEPQTVPKEVYGELSARLRARERIFWQVRGITFAASKLSASAMHPLLL